VVLTLCLIDFLLDAAMQMQCAVRRSYILIAFFLPFFPSGGLLSLGSPVVRFELLVQGRHNDYYQITTVWRFFSRFWDFLFLSVLLFASHGDGVSFFVWNE